MGAPDNLHDGSDHEQKGKVIAPHAKGVRRIQAPGKLAEAIDEGVKSISDRVKKQVKQETKENREAERRLEQEKLEKRLIFVRPHAKKRALAKLHDEQGKERTPEELKKISSEHAETKEIKEVEGTQVFLDRCGFTNTTNTYIELFPKGQVKINREVDKVLNIATDIFLAYGGEIVEFQGDAMRAFFPKKDGDSTNDNHAHRAVRAMTRIQRKVQDLDTDWINMKDTDNLTDKVNRLPEEVAQSIEKFARQPRNTSELSQERLFSSAVEIVGKNVFVEKIPCVVDGKTYSIGVSLDAEKQTLMCHVPAEIDSPVRKIRITYKKDEDTGKMVPQTLSRGIVSEIKMGAASDTTEEIIVGRERLTSMVTQNSVEKAEGKADKGQCVLHPSTIALLNGNNPVTATSIEEHPDFHLLDVHSAAAKKLYESELPTQGEDTTLDTLTLEQLKFLNAEVQTYLDTENLAEIDDMLKEEPEKSAGMYRTCAVMLKFPGVAKLLEEDDQTKKVETIYQIHQIIMQAAKTFGVRVVKCPAGTTYIALSGIPSQSNPTNEDFEYRAVLFANAVKDEIQKLYEPKEGGIHPEFLLKSGVETATNFWGAVGDVTRASEFNPIGPNVNMAARIAYDKGTTASSYVSGDIMERLKDRINFGESIKRSYKGFKGERDIYELRGHRIDSMQETHRGKTYGYEGERKKLNEILGNGGGVQITTIEGHGGMGKSRIIYDAKSNLAIGHCSEFADDPLSFMKNILKDLLKKETFARIKDDTDENYRMIIHDLLKDVTDNQSEFTLEDLTPLLCSYLGIECDDNETTKSIKQSNLVDEKMPALIKAFMRSLAKRSSVNIAIDDLHYSKLEAREFITELIEDIKTTQQKQADKHTCNIVFGTRPKTSKGKVYNEVQEWLSGKSPNHTIELKGIDEESLKKMVFITHMPFGDQNSTHFSWDNPALHVEPNHLVNLIVSTAMASDGCHDPGRAIQFVDSIKEKLIFVPTSGQSNGYYEAGEKEGMVRANMNPEELKELVGNYATSSEILTQRLKKLSYGARNLLSFAASLGGMFTEGEIRIACKIPAGWFRNGKHPLGNIIKESPVETEHAIEKAIAELSSGKSLLQWDKNEFGEPAYIAGTDIQEITKSGDIAPGVTKKVMRERREEKKTLDVTTIRKAVTNNIAGTKAMQFSAGMREQTTDTSNADIAAGFTLKERAESSKEEIIKGVMLHKALTTLVSARQQLQGTGSEEETTRIKDLDRKIVELGEEAGSLWLKFDQRMAEKCFRTAKDHCKDKKRKISLTFAQLVPLAQTGKNEEAREMYETMREKFEAEGLSIIEKLETLQKEAQSIEKDNAHDREALCAQLEATLEAANKVIPDKNLHTQLNEEIDTFEQILSSRRDPIINKELRDKAVERLQSILESVEKEESVAPKIQNTCLKLQGILTGIIEGNGKYTEDIELRRLCEVIGGKPTKDRFEVAMDETEGMLQKMYIHQVKIIGNLAVQITEQKEKLVRYGEVFRYILKAKNIKLLRVIIQNIGITLKKLVCDKGALIFFEFAFNILGNKSSMDDDKKKIMLFLAVNNPEKLTSTVSVDNLSMSKKEREEMNILYKLLTECTETNSEENKGFIEDWITYMKQETIHILANSGRIRDIEETVEELESFNLTRSNDRKIDLTDEKRIVAFHSRDFEKAKTLSQKTLEMMKQKGIANNEIAYQIANLFTIAHKFNNNEKNNKNEREEIMNITTTIEKKLIQTNNKTLTAFFYPIYAWCHHLAGNHEKALEIISKPGAIGEPYEILGKAIQGIILHKNGDQDKAEECYEEAMAMIKEKERDEDWNIEYTHEWMYLSELGKSLSGIAA